MIFSLLTTTLSKSRKDPDKITVYNHRYDLWKWFHIYITTTSFQNELSFLWIPFIYCKWKKRGLVLALHINYRMIWLHYFQLRYHVRFCFLFYHFFFFFFNLMSMECFQFPQKENASRKQRLECLVPSVISFLYTFILPESYSVLTI